MVPFRQVAPAFRVTAPLDTDLSSGSHQHAYLLLQYGVELRPNFIFLCALEMAKGAHFFGLHRGRRSLRFVMIEIEKPPASRGRVAFGIFDGHIGAVEGAGEISSSRRLAS